MLPDERTYLPGLGHDYPHLAREGKRQVAGQVRIEGINRGNQDRAIVGRQRHDPVGAGQAGFHEAGHGSRQRGGQFRGIVPAQVPGHGAEQRWFVHHPVLHQRGRQRFPGRGMLSPRPLPPGRFAQPAVSQQILNNVVVPFEHG